ncbi:hypothetical protein NDU88_008738 [Pleurodeles waltl]|uniref:Uncharacterized protein n=1 Tax=Pleurodeles waltl TaxID=8319 RepID=A0AAV7QVE9_PLEWA|nr:hypothetical protein NDU88_008738 [Pleurodeles waltl]
MQICAAERSEAERHRGCVSASHLTRAGILSCVACSGDVSSRRRAVGRQQGAASFCRRCRSGAGRVRGAAMLRRARSCARTSAASTKDDGLR